MNAITVLKADSRKNARSVLRSFLNKTEPKLAAFLQRFWKEQANAISYADLREAFLNGEINEEWVHQWQQDYSQFVTEHLQPLWISAMQEAAQRQKEKSSGWNFDIAAESVHHWTSQRGAAFVTNCTNTQRNALQAVISRIANTDQNVDQLARLVRPMIGLTRPQSIANANYAQTLRSKRLPPKRVAELSMQYAARQHRYRAQMIARTELAFAFNQGTIEWARQAQDSGYLGKAVKVWSSARDKRSCSICKNLHGTEVLLDEPFPFETKLSDPDVRLAPPAHPHCRCAIDIREIEPSQFDYIEEIDTKPLPESERYDIIEEISEPETSEKTPTLTNAAGVPIIIVDRIDPRHGPPNGITQRVGKKGGIDRNFYNEQGIQILQISNNGHGHKDEEKLGNHGEHAHDYIIDEKAGIFDRRSARELSDKERKDNSDFL